MTWDRRKRKCIR